ncbi:GTPase-activating protein [Kappamyces sp. JEL0829]|nr:GTPase-activating protein [Kappamyces sp. JEL0829]
MPLDLGLLSKPKPLTHDTKAQALSEHTLEEQKMMTEIAKLNSLSIRCQKFKTLLELPNVDFGLFAVAHGRSIAQTGLAWYTRRNPPHGLETADDATLARKRAEYQEFIGQIWGRGEENMDQALHHQIHIDIQRTNANIKLYQNETTQQCLERILYIWAIRHPASGYVQGINDLLTPFYQVFLMEFLGASCSSDPPGANVEESDPSTLAPAVLEGIEADCYWCLTKLLDGIQDNYIHKQPGITRQVGRLKELVSRVDAPLAAHLQTQGVEFIQFAFRWMNCLLMRELSLKITIRMWDSYQSDGPDGFSEFHLYVCAAFLIKWSAQIKKMEFSQIDNLHQLSQLLGVGLDRQAIGHCVTLLEAGVNPEALAAVVRELKRESAQL